MDATSESSGKRKRTPGAEEGRLSAPPPTMMHAGVGSSGPSGGVTQINYLMRAKSERLRLIEGDSETFGDVLGMIDDYEGGFVFRPVLSRS